MTGPRSTGGKAGPRSRPPASFRYCATRSTSAVAHICERGKVGRRCLGSAALPGTGRLAAISVVSRLDTSRAPHEAAGVGSGHSGGGRGTRTHKPFRATVFKPAGPPPARSPAVPQHPFATSETVGPPLLVPLHLFASQQRNGRRMANCARRFLSLMQQVLHFCCLS